jgi:dihydroxyacetone kinase-like protein
MTRFLMNEPDTVVSDALEGLEIAHRDLLRVHRDPRYVTRRHGAQNKVALVSGGGSGHEPLHSGFVGTGMLDAAVPGAVFSSPTAHQICAAVGAVDAGEGAVLIVKNYTGDVLNFSIAAEVLRAEHQVEMVLVDDDLATEPTAEGGPGRRGTAAVLAVEKICGAAAEQGASLKDVHELGRRVVQASATLGLAMQACTYPGQTRRSFDLSPGEVEFGVGIHGERGREVRAKTPARELVQELAHPVLEALGVSRGDAVIAIVNGLGGTHALEQAIATRELSRYLTGCGVQLARVLNGSYVTSLDMAGLSVTLVRATDEFLALWDQPVRTPALTW